ncbi:PqqD family peptide modification chaperone [Zavarzinia sp. CC-PAN008]|uniref:PqqD family peptide modification chaperone n=1 Tax=Zavarzinia sp. CC-PAN008 TaxID=3243332 RepID=UPI003F748694
MSKTPLTSQSIVSRADGFIEADADGEVLALHVENGTCYGFNKVGSAVWTLIEQPTSVAAICESLMQRYDVDQATCERQVVDLLEELRGEDMIVVG